MTEQHQTLDLRLLPAALVGWAAALVVVHNLPEGSIGWILALVAGTVVVSIVTWFALPRRHSRTRRLVLQVALCVAVGAGVTSSAVMTQDSHQQSGWNAAIQADPPVEVIFRVTRDSLPYEQRGFGGRSGYRSQAAVQSFGAHQPVRAEVLVFTDSELQAGHRYTGMMTTVPTPAGDRTTALLYPFGEEPVQLPADRWSQISDRFSGLRAATADQSSYAIGEAPALLPGVVLGDRSGQSAELTEAMRISGLTHMTVVSGTHCSLAMGALLGIARMMRLPRWTMLPLLLTGLVLFVMLVQPAPSVIRASVMGALGALAVFAGRGRASSALLCLCVIVLLIYDPWFSVEAAFQLSVSATIGIVLLGTRLKTFFSQWMPQFLASALALAVSAQLFVTPVLLPIAEGVTLYSIPANILAGPLLPLATVPGTLAAVLSTSAPWISTALLWMAGFPAAGIALIGYAAASLPQALVPWPDGAAGWVLAGLYTAAAILLCRMVIDSARRAGPAAKALLGAAAGALTALVLPLSGILGAFSGEGLPENWRLALCDVGQGDMTVIRTQEASGIVIDAGEDPGPAGACMERLGLERVEILMVTHEHRDHYGGVSGVADAVDIGQILYSGSAGWSVVEAVEVLDDLRLEVPEVRAQEGQSAQHSEGYPVRWQVASAADYHPNPNNNSLVVQFDLWDTKMSADAVGSANNPLRLLTLGDLEEDVAALLLARGMLPVDSDVVKVAHHGAANGGTEILEYTTPSVALIGVGEDNSYGHPADQILEAAKAAGSAVYRTDMHGTVAFSLTDAGLEAVSFID